MLSTSIPLSTSQWTTLGPAPLTVVSDQTFSGRIAAIAAHPTNANIIYVAAASGGVWKTTDGGFDWTPLTDTQSTLNMGSIAIAPSNPNIVYAGTGEGNYSGSGALYGRGMLKSTDGGTTWSMLGNSVFNRRSICKVVVRPDDANVVYAAVTSSNFDLPGNKGIWKSDDGGTTWVNTAASITSTEDYYDVVIDPTNPDVLYASVGGTSATNGVYKTTDGGTSWARSGDFPADKNNGRIALALSPSSPQTLYASVAAADTRGLYRLLKTTNGGATWTPLTGVPNYLGFQGFYDTTLIVDPHNPDVVYAGGQTQYIRSSDGGVTWSDIGSGVSGPHPDHHGVAFDSNGSLLDGNDGGLWRLENAQAGSIRWTDLNGSGRGALNTIQFNGIAVHPTDANIAFGGSQDNGTGRFNDSLSWTQIRGGDGGVVRVDPSNGNTVYQTLNTFGAGSTNSTRLSRSDDGGSTWTAKTSGINGTDPARFYVPFVIDPGDHNRLLLGTNRVYETVNRSDSWTPISSPNTAGWTTSRSVTSIASAEADVNTIYASTSDGKIFVTSDRGATWSERSVAGAGSWTDLWVDSASRQTVYAVRSWFGGGHVYRTGNGGADWANISGNLPDISAWSMAVDPNGPGTADDVLYVGMDDGVYRSADLALQRYRC